MNAVLNYLLRKVCENFYFSLNLLNKYFVKFNNLQQKKKSIEALYHQNGIGEVKYNPQERTKIIQKNNEEILNILKICSSYCTNGIHGGFSKFVKTYHDKKLNQISEICLETFYDYLSERNIIGSYDVCEQGTFFIKLIHFRQRE